MRGKSVQIQEAILSILKECHNLRTEKILPMVCKMAKCSPTPVYRNLKILANMGKIGLVIHQNGNKDYFEIIITSKAEEFLKGSRISLKAIEDFNGIVNEIINNLDETKQFQLLDAQFQMHEIFYANYKCMEIYPVMKKNKEFVKMKKEYEGGFENTIKIIDKIQTKKQRDELYFKLNQSRIYRLGKLSEEVNKILKDFKIKTV